MKTVEVSAFDPAAIKEVTAVVQGGILLGTWFPVAARYDQRPLTAAPKPAPRKRK